MLCYDLSDSLWLYSESQGSVKICLNFVKLFVNTVSKNPVKLHYTQGRAQIRNFWNIVGKIPASSRQTWESEGFHLFIMFLSVRFLGILAGTLAFYTPIPKPFCWRRP